MQTTPRIPSPPRTLSGGFTLVELMIAVVVVAVLAAIAYPSFLSAVRKSRRSDAMAALSALQQAQERFRNNNPTYAGPAQLVTATNATPPGLGLSDSSPSGYYTIAIAAADAVTYTLTATGVPGKTQADDGDCTNLGIDVNGGNIKYGSGSGALTGTDTNRCWAR
jgi:type IV pilus assembly protein PilE